MNPTIPTTPFGQRSLSLGHIATQMQVSRVVDEAGKPGSNHPAAVNKWQIFRTLTEIRERLGVSDRALSVLHALLSFHQETALTLPKALRNTTACVDGETCFESLSCDLVVFPSNKALTLRAHGMAQATLRRHLAMLVDAGLIIRRDSPNGKRYARKDLTGAERFSDVFGFDLTPLVTRAPEFESLAEDVRRLARSRALLKERITLLRRDVSKIIACGLDEVLAGDWESFRLRFLALVTPLRRMLDDAMLTQTLQGLVSLRDDASSSLAKAFNTVNLSGNESDFGRHQSNTKSESYQNLEPASEKEGGDFSHTDRSESVVPETDKLVPLYPIGMVLEACPDVKEYAEGGSVRSWAEFLQAVRIIRPMLGISPDAWQSARSALGELDAHIVVASILQRSEYSSETSLQAGLQPGSTITVVNGSPAIKSAGGYLRALTEKALSGDFALGPVLMALIGQRLKSRRATVVQ